MSEYWLLNVSSNSEKNWCWIRDEVHRIRDEAMYNILSVENFEGMFDGHWVISKIHKRGDRQREARKMQ